MGIAIISGTVWFLFLFDNLDLIRKRHVLVVFDFLRFLFHVLVFCPLMPLLQYFIAPVAGKIGAATGADAVSSQISRAISLSIVSSLHRTVSGGQQSMQPSPDPDHSNDSFSA